MVVRSGNSAPVDDAATVGIAPAAARASKITVPTTSTAVEESEAASIKALLAQVDRLSSRLEDVTVRSDDQLWNIHVVVEGVTVCPSSAC